MSLVFQVKVVPSAGRQEWKVDKNGTLKCFVLSPPERGQANKELIKFLAKMLGVPQTSIEILSGDTQRIKRLQVRTDHTYDDVLKKLGVVTQQQLFWE